MISLETQQQWRESWAVALKGLKKTGSLTALLDLLRGTKSTQSQLSVRWRGGGKCWEQSKTVSDVSGSNKNSLFHSARGHLEHLCQHWLKCVSTRSLVRYFKAGWRCLTDRKYVRERTIMSKLYLQPEQYKNNIKD